MTRAVASRFPASHYLNRELRASPSIAAFSPRPGTSACLLLERLRFSASFRATSTNSTKSASPASRSRSGGGSPVVTTDGCTAQGGLPPRHPGNPRHRHRAVPGVERLPAAPAGWTGHPLSPAFGLERGAARGWIQDYFRREMVPVLTPSASTLPPLPRVLNKASLRRRTEGKDAFGRSSGAAIVQAPRVLPRVIRLPEELAGCEYGFVFLSSILHEFVGELFSGMNVLGCYQFRVTRNPISSVDEEEVTNLVHQAPGRTPQRHFGDAVRSRWPTTARRP